MQALRKNAFDFDKSLQQLSNHGAIEKPNNPICIKPSQNALWEFESSPGTWCPMLRSAASEAEVAFSAHRTTCIVEVAPFKYTVDLSAMTQTNQKTMMTRNLRRTIVASKLPTAPKTPATPANSTTVSRTSTMPRHATKSFPATSVAFAASGLGKAMPQYWPTVSGGVQFVPLGEQCPTRCKVEAMLKESLNSSCLYDASVIEVQALVNRPRFRSYQCKRQELVEVEPKLPSGVNERWLWHGTSGNLINSIAENGLLRDYNSVSVYGRGTYFAKNAEYSLIPRYTPNEPDGTCNLLLCRVLPGELTMLS